MCLGRIEVVSDIRVVEAGIGSSKHRFLVYWIALLGNCAAVRTSSVGSITVYGFLGQLKLENSIEVPCKTHSIKFLWKS